MRVVKLDRRHNLYQQGYRHALRFPDWSSARRYEHALIKQYGHDWDNSKCWKGHWGSKQRNSGSRIYWVGFTDEKFVTQILLTVGV